MQGIPQRAPTQCPKETQNRRGAISLLRCRSAGSLCLQVHTLGLKCSELSGLGSAQQLRVCLDLTPHPGALGFLSEPVLRHSRRRFECSPSTPGGVPAGVSGSWLDCGLAIVGIWGMIQQVEDPSALSRPGPKSWSWARQKKPKTWNSILVSYTSGMF